MIESATGNLLTSDVEALVNSVNCEGFMGKGLALQFKQAFPENFRAYQNACRRGEVQPGRMFVHETGRRVNPRWIVNFPTKRTWRGNSRMEDIETGLGDLVGLVRTKHISSIAIPPLGCGLGGLRWERVRPAIEKAFAPLEDVRVLLFAPQEAPAARAMPIGTKRPDLTVPRALFIRLMGRYRELDYRLTLLEIQKLAYFLQESEQPLKLDYVKHLYGPYADNLNKVIELLEGHYVRGYTGSRKPDVPIELLPGALEEAEGYLAGHDQEARRLDRVSRLIDGFETPYGLEMLSSLHWLAAHDDPPARSADEAVERVHNWTPRKRGLFRPQHLKVAWQRLEEQGWLPARSRGHRSFGPAEGTREGQATPEPADSRGSPDGTAGGEGLDASLSEEARSFIAAHALEQALRENIELARASFRFEERPSVSCMCDPESGDEWVVLELRARGGIEEVTTSHRRYTEALARSERFAARSRIRLSIDMVE